MADSNPNGANQYNLDPRQKLCWDFYVNPKSETFGNALQSALKAGYEETYANQITVSEWFVEKVRRLNLLGKAEKVLEEMLELPVLIERTDRDGESVVMTDTGLVKIKQDTAKFITERRGKDEGYSTRTEHTGANGEKLYENQEAEEKAKAAIIGFLNPGEEQADDSGDTR
jgi:hypothetical protein